MSNPTPRLLYVVNVAWFFISHRLALAVEARRRGYVVHLVTTVTDPKDAQVIRDAGIVLHEVAVSRGGLKLGADLLGAWQLARIIRDVRPDIVHLVTMKPILIGGILARWLRVPRVVFAVSGLGFAFQAEGAWARCRRALIERGMQLAMNRPRARVIFQNEDDLELLVGHGAVRAKDAVLIRGSGVDLAIFAPRATERRPGPVRIVLPARMLREKGVYEFIEAGRILRARGVVASMLLAGGIDPSNPGSLTEAELTAGSAEGAVHWLGHQRQMLPLLQDCDIACLPSYREGLPKALIEAAACGLPIVTTDAPGCREVVEPGVNGLLVAPRDATALADALGRLIDAPDLRRQFGAASRELAMQSFSLAQVIHQTLALYEGL